MSQTKMTSPEVHHSPARAYYFFAQSPAVRAKVISLTSARNMAALGKVVYRRDQRKISDALMSFIGKKSGHRTTEFQCLLLGVKRTSRRLAGMY